MKRRDFLVQSALLTAGVGLAGRSDPLAALTRGERRAQQSADFRALAMRALDAARSAGAEYADVRISRNRTQQITTREQRVTGLADTETFGLGVRVLADGAWGFAASYNLAPDELVRAARQAVSQARANASTRKQPVALAPTAGPS